MLSGIVWGNFQVDQMLTCDVKTQTLRDSRDKLQYLPLITQTHAHLEQSDKIR